jgi:GAF domain-containing protein
VHVPELAVAADSEFGGAKALIFPLGYRGPLLAVPMMREGVAIGAISASRKDVRPFTDKQIALLQTFADQAVIAIENTRLFTELQERLEQQTATSEILRAISQSQRDVQPVFEAIAVNARALCDATFAGVYTFDGDLIHFVALSSSDPGRVEAIRRAYPVPPSRGGGSARAVLTRAVVHIPDVRDDADYRLESVAEAAGYRSVVSVPMLRQAAPIGVITICGASPAMFTERQIAILQTSPTKR